MDKKHGLMWLEKRFHHHLSRRFLFRGSKWLRGRWMLWEPWCCLKWWIESWNVWLDLICNELKSIDYAHYSFSSPFPFPEFQRREGFLSFLSWSTWMEKKWKLKMMLAGCKNKHTNHCECTKHFGAHMEIISRNLAHEICLCSFDFGCFAVFVANCGQISSHVNYSQNKL